eukprot:gene39095-48285_t
MYEGKYYLGDAGYEDEFDNDQWREQAEEENRHEQHVNGNQTAAEDA